MQILSPAQTQAALPWNLLLDAIEKGFLQPIHAPLRHHHYLHNADTTDDVLLLMPAWSDSDWGGVKIANIHPGNAEKGLAALTSTYLLFERTTGRHMLMLDGGELTARRTAAASALAAQKLARPDSCRLLVVGAGRVGANIPYAYRAALPIESVQVWSRTQSQAEALVRALCADGIAATLATDLQTAVTCADIVSCATLTHNSIIKGAWLQPGQHLDLIGSFTPYMREADDTAIQCARVFIDTEHAKTESGDLQTPLQTGTLAEHDILGTLADLCRGNIPARVSDTDITLFKSTGTAIEDLSAAVLAFQSLEVQK